MRHRHPRMAHSFGCNWFHIIWRTKRSYQYLQRSVNDALYSHIVEYARESGYHIDTISGTENHVHVLVELRNNQHPSAFAQAIKGESAHWINFRRLTTRSFAWQPGFASFTVSKGLLPRIRGYIHGQLHHHDKLSFRELMHRIVELHDRPPRSGRPETPE